MFQNSIKQPKKIKQVGYDEWIWGLHDCFLTNKVSPSWGWHQADVGEALPQLARIEGEYGFRRPLGLRVGEMGIQPAWGRPKFPVKGIMVIGVCVQVRFNDSMNYLCVNRSGTSICGFPIKAISTKKPTVGVGWTFSSFFLATDTFLMWITLYQVDLPGSHLFYFLILSISIRNDEPQLLSKLLELNASKSAGFNALDMDHPRSAVSRYFCWVNKLFHCHPFLEWVEPMR